MNVSVRLFRAPQPLYLLVLSLLFKSWSDEREMTVAAEPSAASAEGQREIIFFRKLQRKLFSPLTTTVRLQNKSEQEARGGDFSSFPISAFRTKVEWITPPDLPCNEHVNCSKAYDTSLPLVCSEDGKCVCSPPLCWVYSVDSSGFFLRIFFSCDWCGQLGSECSEDVACNYPGNCFEDGFCHCLKGEHKGDICYAHNGSILLQFLVAGLVISLILVATVVIYQTLLSYRHNRIVCWCSRPSACRRRQHSQAAVQRRRRTLKTPAFTTQQLIFQNFNVEDEQMENEKANVFHRSSINSEDIEEVVNMSHENATSNDQVQESSEDCRRPSTMEGIPSETRVPKESQKQDIRSDDMKNTLEENSGTPSLDVVHDNSGMTDYYNSFSHSDR